MSVAHLGGSAEAIRIGKIVCIGLNYTDHANEMGSVLPARPVVFLKPATAVVHDGGSVRIPSISSEVHHETEMTVLIGKGGSSIARDRSLRHVAGYGVGLDMTLRDLQREAKKSGQPWALSKGFDTSAPLSAFVPAAKIKDPGALQVQLEVNGKERQSGFTRNLIFGVDELISFISSYITLEPGDVIFTGTPSGVAPVRSGDELTAKLFDAAASCLASLHVRVR